MPWEELLSARLTGARQSALFIGRIRGRLNPKDLGQLAGGISSQRYRDRIRRFTQRHESDRTHLAEVSAFVVRMLLLVVGQNTNFLRLLFLYRPDPF